MAGNCLSFPQKVAFREAGKRGKRKTRFCFIWFTKGQKEMSDYYEDEYEDYDDYEAFCEECGGLLTEFDGVWWCDYCSNAPDPEETQEAPVIDSAYFDDIPF